jgi:hypothetical protein
VPGGAVGFIDNDHCVDIAHPGDRTLTLQRAYRVDG